MAGCEGFEPPITGPEPVALPLGQSPILSIPSTLSVGSRTAEIVTKERAIANSIASLVRGTQLRSWIQDVILG